MKILILDDDPDVLFILRTLLEQRRYDVSTLSMSKNFESDLKKHQPDVILLDIHMGPRSGLEICQYLKHSHLTNIPVVMMSGLENSEQMAYSAGAEAYIKKPFYFNSLLLEIQSVAGVLYN